MKKYKHWINFGLLVVVLVACGPQSTPTPGPIPATWIDAPLQGSVLPLASYNLVFHGASFAGISEFEVQVNGNVIGAVPPKLSGPGGSEYGTLFYGDYEWSPNAPGTYLIAVQAKDGNNQIGPSAQIQVTVAEEISIGEVSPPEVLPPEGEELPPNPVMPMFDTNLFYYGGSCAPSEIQVEIQVPDPEAYSVVMFFRLRAMDSEERSDWEAMAMNPGSNGYFNRTITSSMIPDRDMFQSAYFQVQVVGTNQAGDEIIRTEVIANQITLMACDEEPVPPEEPTDTAAPALPECSDGIDNDGDGDVDMADGRCLSPEDDDESG